MSRQRPKISKDAAPPLTNDAEDDIVIKIPAAPRTTPLKVLRHKCLDCVGGLPREVYLCGSVDCPLWPWRMGVRPENQKQIKANEDALRVRAGHKPKHNYTNISDDDDS